MMSKNQLLVIALILALVVNTVTHFTHPAYSFYRDNMDALYSRQSEFEDKVKSEFIPAFEKLITNQVNVIRSPSSLISPTVSPSVPLSDNLIQSRKIAYDYFLYNGSPCFRYHGWCYFVGSFFYGRRIVTVYPEMIVTDGLVYFNEREDDGNLRSDSTGS